MILTEKETKEFEEAARPLIKFLNDRSHPHVIAVVDCTSAGLHEGIVRIVTYDYIKD